MAFIPSAGKATTPSPPTGDESQKPLSEPTHAVTGVSTPLTSATHTRNETMMEALFELQVGNIDSAITLVANAFSLFDCDLSCSNHGGGEPSLLSHEGMCEYLPGLLFLVCLRCVINDHFSLHRRIPPCLSLVFSRAISSTPEEMRAHCMRVLSDTSRTSEQEWTDLVSTASLRGNVDQHHQQESAATSSWSEEQSWSFKFFVALWKLYCSPSSSYHHQISSAQIFEMSGATNLPPPPQASPPSCAENNTLRMIPWRAASVTFLGFCYFFGVGGADKDIHKAVTLYQLAADAGHADAMCKLGARYASGTGVDKDVHKAVSLHQRAADAGDTMATFFLGVCYINGEGVTKDAGKAVLLWLRASVAGNVKAMQNLGVCYANGDGVDKDIHKAVTLWKRAADAGDANAMLNLGTCYCHGDGVEKDSNMKAELWKRAADAGNVGAMSNLGWCYFTGDGVDKDIPKAYTLFQRAADAGDAEAILGLGACYYNGDCVQKDRHKALRLWQRAAYDGSAEAMCNIAHCYQRGKEGFPKDIHEAMRLWLWAADLGHPTAISQLRILQLRSKRGNHY